MIGHGRPNGSLHRPSELFFQALRLGFVLLVACCLPARAARSDEAPASLRLRVEWGSSDPRVWEGRVEVVGGAVMTCRPLGFESDEIGSMWIDGDALQIKAAGVRSYDGVDLDVLAPLDAVLSVRMTALNGQPKTFEVPLRSVLSTPAHAQLDAGSARLIVRRAPGDALRVKLLHPSAVYTVGETLDLELEPYLLGVEPGTRVELHAAITPARGDRELWSDTAEREARPGEFSLGAIPFSAPLPKAEGVYDLTVTASPHKLSNRLGWKRNLASRKVQVVVLDPQAPTRTGPDESSFTVLSEIDAANPRWWGQKPLAQAGGLVPGLKKGAFGSGHSQPFQHAAGVLMRLDAAAQESQTTWEAYPLAVQSPGEPHILEIEYPRDTPQLLGISLIEPDPTGAVKPIGLDSGVFVPEANAADSSDGLATHRMIVWPHTKTPFVLVTNRRNAPAAYGKIRLIGPTAGAAWSIARTETAHLSPAILPSASEGRLLGVGYDRPLFPQNFSASEALDGESRRPLTDWQTFYEGGARLVEYLRHTGRNAAVVAALADGSTIYPSELLEPTPRYDTGPFFTSAQDPFQKDVLEMLFRLFDREGLTLIPSLQFSAPLPKLEALRRDRAAAQIEMTNPAGIAWTRLRRPRQGLGAYYNPLDPLVKTSIQEVVSELAGRYSSHASFGGVAIQLSPDGYLQFPGEEWGASREVVARFAADQKLPFNGLPGRPTADFITLHRDAWLDWRAAQLAAFHQQIGESVAALRKSARVYMLGAHMLDGSELAAISGPRRTGESGLAAALLASGLKSSIESDSPSLVWSRPERITPAVDIESDWRNIRFNSDASLDQAFAAREHAAAIFFHEPQELRLKSFDAASPFQPCQLWLRAQQSPSEEQNRRRYAAALARADARALFDCGWLLPLGQEKSLSDFVSVYRQLPDVPFETLDTDCDPIVIRSHTTAKGAYLYLVNNSPWTVRATLELKIDAASSIISLRPQGARLAPRAGQGVSFLDFMLEPYGVDGVRTSDTRMRVVSAKAAPDSGAATGLDLRIRELSARVASLQQPREFESLTNPGFDAPPAAEAIPGWVVRSGAADTTESEAQAGARRLRLIGGRGATVVESEPLEAPRLDKLVVAVWARLSGDPARSRLRMTLEGTASQGRCAWHAQLCSGEGASASRAATWNRYELRVDPLPAGFKEPRIRFEFEGAGEASIDSVELFEPELDRDELNSLRKLLFVANFKLQEGKLAECQKLLDGDWPRWLESRVPLPPANVAAKPAATPLPRATLRDKWKNYLPGMLR